MSSNKSVPVCCNSESLANICPRILTNIVTAIQVSLALAISPRSLSTVQNSIIVQKYALNKCRPQGLRKCFAFVTVSGKAVTLAFVPKILLLSKH